MLRVLCAALPVAGLLLPLAAAPAVPAAPRGAGTQRPIGPDPAVSLPAHGDLTVGATATVDYSVTVRSPLTPDAELANTVTSTAYRNKCGRGSTDPACAATVTVTAPGPSPSPSSSPSSPSSSAPTPSGSPGSTASGRLPETGTAGALPLIGLAALGCVLAGLMVLVAKARRKH